MVLKNGSISKLRRGYYIEITNRKWYMACEISLFPMCGLQDISAIAYVCWMQFLVWLCSSWHHCGRRD